MLNTYVAGNPGSVRASADAIRKTGTGVDATADGWHRARSRSEAIWEGEAADGFRDSANRNGRDADALADLFTRLAGAVTVFADDLDTVRARMEHAKQAARDGELTVHSNAIQPPAAAPAAPPEPPRDPASAAESTAQPQAVFQAAQALQAKQQAAFAEAQAIVSEARKVEQAAHVKLADSLNATSKGLGGIGQSGTWTHAAAAPTDPAAAALAGAAANLETQSANATRTMFESALAGGPFTTRGMWASMTSAQQTEMINRFPGMVGKTDGIPAASRDLANRSILNSQRLALVSKLDAVKRKLRGDFQREGHSDTSQGKELKELSEALRGIEALQGKLGVSAEATGQYLLGINSTSNERGQAIIASGNPDQANNTMTLVPGTFSDLGDATDYATQNEKVLDRANELSQSHNCAITWTGYNSPNHLFPDAAFGSYADHAHGDLSKFQEGLRATHEGEAPSHNTLVGHSYGSTVVGETATNGGSHADDLVFLGSPGVGVDNANGLDVPHDHVWAAKSASDVIDYTPSPNPLDWPSTISGDADYTRFGLDPTDPKFGGNLMPTDPSGDHGSYWDKAPSRESMAQIMTRPHGEGGS